MPADDRTLLARLGFQDDDRRDPLHDLACAYLAEPEQAARLLSMLPPLTPGALEGVVPREPTVELERVISTRSGFTVGFADLVLSRRYVGRNWGSTDTPFVVGVVLVEVKIQRVSVGVLIRQLKLYEEHLSVNMHGMQKVAAIGYSISETERSMLHNEGIRIAKLGDGFRVWRERTGRDGAVDEVF